MKVLIGKSMVNGTFSIAMFDYWRVTLNLTKKNMISMGYIPIYESEVGIDPKKLGSSMLT